MRMCMYHASNALIILEVLASQTRLVFTPGLLNTEPESVPTMLCSQPVLAKEVAGET